MLAEKRELEHDHEHEACDCGHEHHHDHEHHHEHGHGHEHTMSIIMRRYTTQAGNLTIYPPRRTESLHSGRT